MMRVRTDDTIGAVSSPPGTAPLGIVRISGPDALRAADAVFRAADGAALAGRAGYTRWAGAVLLRTDGPSVPGEVYVFRGPRSYTRQDTVEIHTCGAAPVLSLVLEQLLACGVRQAEPGEFTMRAYLAGAMDLTAAEGVSARISATSDAQLRAANRLAGGALAQQIASLLDRFADLLALIEADIDFAEEPIDFVSPAQIQTTLAALLDDIAAVRDHAVDAERLETLPRVVLAGPSNAGKSTLMNRLTGLDRAICSPRAGTTRDILTAPLALPRGEVMLVDGAGLADTHDVLIHEGKRRVRDELATADLVCAVADGGVASAAPLPAMVTDVPAERVLVVLNKIDLLPPTQVAARCRALAERTRLEVVAVSARTGDGCDALAATIDRRLACAPAVVGADALALGARHRQALAEAARATLRAKALAATAAHTADCAELLAIELREACAALGVVAGQVTTEDLLGRVFSRFCIGK